ncbi:MAG: glycosyltransferase [Ketobacteraceae bacterium]|nr:glycosyltransferase [Ketobacteraceae bacterium]
MTQDSMKERPLVTFALFAYNQEKYIREAIEGAFAQTYEPLEIILSDDCSSDRTFEIMTEMANNYHGPHKVVVNQNSENLNIGEHINVIGRKALGDLIVMAAGDDISDPSRAERLTLAWLSSGGSTAVLFSDFLPVDRESRVVPDFSEQVFRGELTISGGLQGDIPVLGATTAYTRDAFDTFPPIGKSVVHEDRVLPFRVMLLGGSGILVDEKLIKYRVDGGVSRDKPKDGFDYVFRYMEDRLSRSIPDSLQRLNDVIFVFPNNKDIIGRAKRHVYSKMLMLEISKNKGLRVETSLFKSLRAGKAFFSVLFFYLKRRFVYLFEIYYFLRFGGAR